MPSFVLTEVWPLRTGDADNNAMEFGFHDDGELGLNWRENLNCIDQNQSFIWNFDDVYASWAHQLYSKKNTIWKCDNKNQWVGKNVAAI